MTLAQQVEQYLATLDREGLAELVRELAEAPDVQRELGKRASEALNADGDLAAHWKGEAQDAAAAGGFINYRRSFDVAHEIDEVLDGLSDLMDRGRAEAALPALAYLVGRIRTLTQRADDSGGMLGACCQRAVELYAKACRADHPKPVPLAKWLFKYRIESPGWPDCDLAGFAPAFDAKAWRTYRELVANAASAGHDKEKFSEFELAQMRLELADHDGDVDLAVSLLSDGRTPKYAGIINRLMAAQRQSEALAWLDRYLASGRLTGRTIQRHNTFDLDAGAVIDILMAADRPGDALGVARQAYASTADNRWYDRLLQLGAQVDSAAAQREWVLRLLRARAEGPHGSGAQLVALALHERDLAAAWSAHDQYGAGSSWESLARASRDTHPARAAQLYLTAADQTLEVADPRNYAAAATYLAAATKLAAAAGTPELASDAVAEVRIRYARRPRLMAELAKVRL